MNIEYIISLEIYTNVFTVHVIVQKTLGKIYTFRTGTIKTKSTQVKIFKWIMEDNFEELVDYFKKEYDILHAPVTLSYGPQIRQMLKERTQHNREV